MREGPASSCWTTSSPCSHRVRVDSSAKAVVCVAAWRHCKPLSAGAPGPNASARPAGSDRWTARRSRRA
eukprot:scaffold7066_cov253-Pinguiococcus_pyrenoidosus.AAC.33